MDAPVSLSELMILKNLARVKARSLSLGNPESAVQDWLSHSGVSKPFAQWVQEAKASSNWTSPTGTQKRLMDYLTSHVAGIDFDHRIECQMDMSFALSRPVAANSLLPSGELGKEYQAIDVSLSPDGLLRFTYRGNGDREYLDAQHVTVSMEQLGLSVQDYTLAWGDYFDLGRDLGNDLPTCSPKDFEPLIDAVAIKHSKWPNSSNHLLVIHSTVSPKHSALVLFGTEPGEMLVARFDDGDAVAYEETFEAIKPLHKARDGKIENLRQRLGLEWREKPFAPQLFFKYQRQGEVLYLADDLGPVNGVCFDEEGERPVSPHFYYGVSLSVHQAIVDLNKDIRAFVEQKLKSGVPSAEVKNEAEKFILAELQSRHGCSGVSAIVEKSNCGSESEFSSPDQPAP
jgi:hypothetical protein